MEIDEVTFLSSESGSPPPTHLDSDDDFPKLKLSDICSNASGKERGKKSGQSAESNSSDSYHSSWSQISKSRKAISRFEPVPSTSKCDAPSYNTRHQFKKRRSNCESPIDLCDRDDEFERKTVEPSLGNTDDVVLISDGSSSNSRLPEKGDPSNPSSKEQSYGYFNCFSKFRDAGVLSPIDSFNFEKNTVGETSKSASPTSVQRNTRKAHELSESDDSGDEAKVPQIGASEDLFKDLATDPAKVTKTPILSVEDEETRLPDDEDSRNSIYSKSTVCSIPAAASNEDVAVESASRMSVEFGFGDLDASCQSDSTLPPDYPAASPDRDRYQFSDPVTYESPSKGDYGYLQDVPSPAKSDPNTSCYNISEVDTQALPNSEPLTQNGRTKYSRQRKSPKSRSDAAAERQRQKELKLQEKAEKAATAEAHRRMRPGECMKYVTAVFDTCITSNNKWAGKVMENLQNGGTIRTDVTISADPYSVRWLRDQEYGVAGEEKHILFLWSTEQLLTSIRFNTLLDQFTDVKRKYDNYKVYLAIYGLRNHYKYQQRAAKKRAAESSSQASQSRRRGNPNHDIEEDRVEMELIALQLRLGISHKLVDSVQDVESFVQELTKSIAEIPYKLEKEKVDMERNWYAKGDSRNCVRIDKDFNGLNQLWLQQLSQFNNSSLDTAKAIAELYPTPLALYNAYQRCLSKAEKEQMLQDITVKRGPGGAGRRLGPELSRKISILFCQSDDILLG